MQSPTLIIGVTPRALSRVAASAYVGVSPTRFDQLVAEGSVPRPARLGRRVLWDRLALDRTLDVLFDVTTELRDEWDIADAAA